MDRICIIGDSITHGTGDETLLGWPGKVFQEYSAITIYNLGVRADTSALIGARWQAEARARLPQAQQCGLIFSFGTNDAAVAIGQGIRVELEQSITNATQILTQAKAWLPCLMIGPIPVIDEKQPFHSGAGVFEFNTARIEAYNAAYQTLADKLAIPYLDIFHPLKANPTWMASQTSNDGVHPKQDGYQELANLVRSWHAFQQFIGS